MTLSTLSAEARPVELRTARRIRRRFEATLVPAVALVLLVGSNVNPSLAEERGVALPPQPMTNSTIPGQIIPESTFECIGVRWYIQGDDNLNCTVTVRFRASGQAIWKAAQPLLRVEPGTFNSYNIDPGDLLAGSVFQLTPDTPYQVLLTLRDPDGGAAVETLSVRTRAVPKTPDNARVRYVVPGTGGGSGTQQDPFRGFAAANAAAAPGDLFLVGPGTYTGTAYLSTSGTESAPITWRGMDRDAVVLDGESTARRVVRFDSTAYVILENLTIRRPEQEAVYGVATHGITVRGCHIDCTVPTSYEMEGIYLAAAGQTDDFIAGNVIEGPLNWEDGRNTDCYALMLAGQGHVVRNNEIFNWYDGMNIGANDTGPITIGCDVYGNEVYNCTDDGIETDKSRHNVRVFNNRFTNCLCGLSAQPVFGGPVYFIRNVVYDWQLKPLKFHEWPTGIICFHNTLVGADPRGWGGGQWRNTILRNNILMGGNTSNQSGDPIALYTTGLRADLDNDGWYQYLPTRYANFNSTAYPHLSDFRAGTSMELHGLLMDISSFVNAVIPVLGSYEGQQGYPPPYPPGSQDLRLRPNSPPVDKGVFLANVNDGYSGSAPDLGAYESGAPLPTYGPGNEQPSSAPEVFSAAAVRLDASPNPFASRVRIRFQGRPEAGSGGATRAIRLRVFDPGGRLVRDITPAGAAGDGGIDVIWDGRDARGRDARAGVYLVRVETGGKAVASGKIIRVR